MADIKARVRRYEIEICLQKIAVRAQTPERNKVYNSTKHWSQIISNALSLFIFII